MCLYISPRNFAVVKCTLVPHSGGSSKIILYMRISDLVGSSLSLNIVALPRTPVLQCVMYLGSMVDGVLVNLIGMTLYSNSW